MKNLTIVPVVLLSLCFAANRAPGAVIISDGTFDNSDYSVIVSGIEPGYPGGNGMFTQEPAGGNPGSYQEDVFTTSRVPYSSATFPADPYGIFGATIDTLTSYDPATQGAITSLTFSSDLKTDAAGDPSFFLYYFVEQNNRIYRIPNPLTTVGDQLTDDWTNYTATETSSAGFVNRITSTPPLNFSATGAPIYFGIGASFLDGNTATVGFDIDNFMVDINAPEPSTWAMLFGGLILVALSRPFRRSCK